MNNIKDRIKVCKNCGYEWLAHNPNPNRCPSCQKKLTTEVKQ